MTLILDGEKNTVPKRKEEYSFNFAWDRMLKVTDNIVTKIQKNSELIIYNGE